MVGAVVDAGRVGAVAGGADNAGAGGQRRIELVRQFRIGGVGELAHDALGDVGDVRLVVEQAGPVGVHAEIKRLVVEQLRGPLDGVDFGDLRRHDQAGDLEQLVVGDLAVADRLGRAVGIAQAAVDIRVGARDLAEGLDDEIVLAHEHIVQERQPDRPIVGERRRLLPNPFRLDRIAARRRRAGRASRPERRQVALAVARGAGVFRD